MNLEKSKSIETNLFCLLNLVVFYRQTQKNYFKEKTPKNLKRLIAIEKQMYERADLINELYFEKNITSKVQLEISKDNERDKKE